MVSAKDPRRWPNLFDFRASYACSPHDARSLPPVRITLPAGELLTTDRADVEPRLSAAVGRPVRLARSAVEGVTAEGYWPDHDWLARWDAGPRIPRSRRARSLRRTKDNQRPDIRLECRGFLMMLQIVY